MVIQVLQITKSFGTKEHLRQTMMSLYQLHQIHLHIQSQVLQVEQFTISR